jgi:hypothetical protein
MFDKIRTYISRDSVASKVTNLRVGRPRYCGSILISSPKCLDRQLGPPSPRQVQTALSPEVSGRGVRLPNYTNRVPRLRITGATPPLTPILHGVRRDNFNFTTFTTFFTLFNYLQLLCLIQPNTCVLPFRIS